MAPPDCLHPALFSVWGWGGNINLTHHIQTHYTNHSLSYGSRVYRVYQDHHLQASSGQ
uniref:Uncharacterized protein n=1 Tax=Anguilla anguilla TaxID=7936 RepID=A0A0E9Q2C6_ANGAN